MDFVQGSTPPIFFLFRLENSLKENPDPPTTQASNPAVSGGTATGSEVFSQEGPSTLIFQSRNQRSLIALQPVRSVTLMLMHMLRQ